jgi:hypothetical protein
MEENEPIDLSPCFTAEDTLRHERRVREVAAAAWAGAARRRLETALAFASPRALLAAAAVAVLAWAPTLLEGRTPLPAVDPLLAIAEATHRGEPLDTADLLRLLGGSHAR